MTRLSFLGAVLILALAQVADAATSTGQPAKRPNILFLLADDQRADTIAALGNKVIQTPNLDRLVKQGTTFTRTYVTVPVCTPSRAELMSGRNPFRNGCRFFNQPIQPDLVLLQQAFARAGYLTWFTGKWHNESSPELRGYQIVRRLFKGGMGAHEKVFVEGGRRIEGFSSQLFADAAIQQIASKGKQPWFMMVAFTAPHDPRTPPGRFRTLYDPQKMPLPSNFLFEHPFDNGEMIMRDELLERWPRTPTAIQQHLCDYYGLISHLDEQIGRILEPLQQSGQLENTIIVFLADNGLAIGSHGLMGKQNMYDHSVRVPFIIGGPDLPKDQKKKSLCTMHDIYPTLCELAGVEVPKTVEGKSLAPILRGQKEQIREQVGCAYQKVHRMVCTQRWKLIHYPQAQRSQLFDLENDPHETSDLLAAWRRPVKGGPAALSPKQREQLVRELEGRLLQWQREVGDDLKLELNRP